MGDGVVLLHSGGLDSTVALHLLLERKYEVLSLGVDYGQRHRRELDAAAATCERLGVEREVLDLRALARHLGRSALVGAELPTGLHHEDPAQAATVVPNRNMVLLALAGAVAAGKGWSRVAVGAHAGDAAVYPDCRPAFAGAMREALRLCSEPPLELLAPLLGMERRAVVRHGWRMGVDWRLTWTCYAGGERPCGECGSCRERAESFRSAGLEDPLA